MSFVPSLAQTFETALAHHRRGCWAEALSVYRALEARQPGSQELLHLIIDVLEHQGSHEDATFEKQRLPKETSVELNLTLGHAFLRVQSWAKATQAFERHLATHPGDSEALLGLSKAHVGAGSLASAITTLDFALNLDPESHALRLNYASCLMADGQRASAFKLIKPLLKQDPFNQRAGRILIDLLPHMSFEALSGDLELTLASLVETSSPRDQKMLAKVITHHLLQEPKAQQAAKLALLGDWTAFYDFFEASELSHLCMRPAFGALLRAQSLKDARLIALTIGLRRCLLKYYLLHQTIASWMDPLLEALALQAIRTCFLRPAPGPEQHALKNLTDQISAMLLEPSVDLDVVAVPLSIIASYEPLMTLPGIQRHFKTWKTELVGHTLQAVFDHHLQAPMSDQKTAQSIKTLSAPTDEVARRIQKQYSDFPTPQWSTLHHHPYETLADWLNALNPTRPAPASLNSAIEILGAGCGTGRELISIVNAIPTRRTVAVDLSKWSLAYAARKAQELLKQSTSHRMAFYQADFQDLTRLNGTYHAIFAGQSLSETANPTRAVRNLMDVMSPDGILTFRLPSKSGNKLIRALKSHILPMKLLADLKGVQTLQQEVWRSDAPDQIIAARGMAWFHDTGSCIHTCFSAQKHAFDLTEVADLLAVCGLKLHAIERPAGLKGTLDYSLPAPDDLMGWHTLEQKTPELFTAGYRLWTYRG